MKKIIKPLLATGVIAVLLAGCSEEKEIAPGTKDEKIVTEGKENISETLYKLKDSDILIEVNGKELTVGEVKKKTFENTLISEINQFTDRILLIEKYGPTDGDLDKELKRLEDAQPNSVEGVGVDKETLRYNMAYENAVKDGIKITKEDLLKIKKEYFPNEKRTFAEMEDELKRLAPFYMGNDVYKITDDLKKQAKIKYASDELKERFEATFTTNPVTEEVVGEKDSEKDNKE